MTERSGVFAVSRAVFDHPLFSEPLNPREAWLWLISEASWEPRRRKLNGQIITLGRGQLAASHRHLARTWKWDDARVTRFLKRLKSEAMIEAATETGITVIAICNYDRFQFGSHDREAASEAPSEASARQERGNTEEIKELKISPAKPRRAKERSLLPEGFMLSDAVRKVAAEHGFLRERADREFERFKGYHRAKGNRFKDWDQAARNWFTNGFFSPNRLSGKPASDGGRGAVPIAVAEPERRDPATFTAAEWRKRLNMHKVHDAPWPVRYWGPAPEEKSNEAGRKSLMTMTPKLQLIEIIGGSDGTRTRGLRRDRPAL
jgi:hypothetical protein